MTALELEFEMAEIKTRLRRLENALGVQGDATDLVPPLRLPQTNEEVVAWMRDQGLVTDPTPEERRLAALWEELPNDEQEAHVHLINSMVLDPPLSEIIIANRR